MLSEDAERGYSELFLTQDGLFNVDGVEISSVTWLEQVGMIMNAIEMPSWALSKGNRLGLNFFMHINYPFLGEIIAQ